MISTCYQYHEFAVPTANLFITGFIFAAIINYLSFRQPRNQALYSALAGGPNKEPGYEVVFSAGINSRLYISTIKTKGLFFIQLPIAHFTLNNYSEDISGDTTIFCSFTKMSIVLN